MDGAKRECEREMGLKLEQSDSDIHCTQVGKDRII